MDTQNIFDMHICIYMMKYLAINMNEVVLYGGATVGIFCTHCHPSESQLREGFDTLMGLKHLGHGSHVYAI